MLLNAKDIIARGIPNMFSTNLTVFLNLQEPAKNLPESCNHYMLEEIEMLKMISTMPPYVLFNLSEWLRDCVYQFIVYPQT